MSNESKARLAHELLDEINARQDLTPEQTEMLRSFLPEKPKQKKLEDLIEHVNDAWGDTHVNEWDAGAHGILEGWLSEFELQLRGLTDVEHEIVAATVPTLPAGMRLADHWNYGRVVVAPAKDGDDERMIFCLDNTSFAGAGRRWVPAGSLTLIDSERAKSTHPEFLETEADYQRAPEGTIVALDDTGTVWLKKFGAWTSSDGDRGVTCVGLSTSRRRVLRWGWGWGDD